MCECEAKTVPGSADAAGGRLKLWEFTDRAHCSVIGTCLSAVDLRKLAAKLRLTFDDDANDYDVHAYFVKAAADDSQEARAIHKLLDTRFAGILRIVARLRGDRALAERWEEMKAKGQIAGAFWALMTHRHVSTEIRARIFGDVHMLSHEVGAAHGRQGRELAGLKSQLEDLEKRRARVEAGLRASIAERDDRITGLESALTEARAKGDSGSGPTTEHTSRRRRHDESKIQRALESARYRARVAEAEIRLLRDMLARAQEGGRTAPRTVTVENSASGRDVMADARRLDGHSYLYIGGRDNQFAYLRDVAGLFGVELIHHDGGLTDAITRIDDVLPSVECVLCPINCVSHDACQRAKSGCKKHGKTFMPLRSASKTSLRDALISLMVGPGGPGAAE
ncbi:MAG: hypothetical protein C0606_00800 [Hyphomicrobiales bacterium]|nr:MAG: hypothetical protein C0606_00800 [Hyphomicrobiales bacterium]